MRAGRVEIAAEIVQIKRNLADGVGAVHVRENAAIAGNLANLLDGENQPRGRRDMAEHDDFGVRRRRLVKRLTISSAEAGGRGRLT